MGLGDCASFLEKIFKLSLLLIITCPGIFRARVALWLAGWRVVGQIERKSEIRFFICSYLCFFVVVFYDIDIILSFYGRGILDVSTTPGDQTSKQCLYSSLLLFLICYATAAIIFSVCWCVTGFCFFSLPSSSNHRLFLDLFPPMHHLTFLVLLSYSSLLAPSIIRW